MRGRRIGQIDVSIEEMQTISTMTQANATRREIAETIERSANTVWRYQKSMGLV